MPELYDFQQEDLDKIFPLGRGANGGEMGTGKTPFACKLMDAWWEDLPKSEQQKTVGDLVVAPLNTFGGWQKRQSEWCPNNDVFMMPRTGQPAQQRARFLRAIEKREADVYVTHWESLRLMPELRKYIFGTIVADEAHRMSNRKTEQTSSLKMLRTHHKLPMSGTLSADHPAGLWSPFHWLYPRDHYMTSYWRFYKSIVDFEIDPDHGYHIIHGLIPEGVEKLHEFMDPFYARHLKRGKCCEHHPNGVMPWLKEKYYENIWVDLVPKQRRLYEQMKSDMLAWVGENEDTPLAAQAAMIKMLRLTQMCLAEPSIRQVWKWLPVDKVDPMELIGLPAARLRRDSSGEITHVHMLVDDVYFEPDAVSAKLDRGIELFKDHDNKQFVVWTSSKRFMDIAVPRLAKKTSLVHVNSDVKDQARQDAIDRFAAGDVQLFFATIQTAEGIDGLQENCDSMLYFDRTWSARMNAQSEDRLHRDGQKNSVMIYDMMARDTVELGNRQKEARKWNWMQMLLNGKINQMTGE